MKRFKHLLVVIPESTPPDALLSWAASLGGASEAEVIDVLRCSSPPLESFPELADGSHSADGDPVTDMIATKLAGLPHQVFNESGNVLRETLSRLSGGSYDLVLTSLHDEESRTLSERLARKSPTGVLALPADAVAPPAVVVAGIDFSDISPLCLEWAEAFATLDSDQPIRKEAVHTIDLVVPSRATLAMPEEKIQERLRSGAHKQMEQLLADHVKNPAEWHPMIIEGRLPGVELSRRTERHPKTLLIVGSHGRNAFSVALLGSRACEAIRHSNGPVLVAKRKNENLRFLRDLLGMD